ncbi:hypothetical protein K1W69_16645 [Hoeflea sp. WL0058]|uniref:Uncharacterized protein n=1 Tax=Flavimaribacter sediminis TaxID=2865987 RepID=A0AAE3D265_9HYPH|nr:hypothetical protein [Flavimaribacter sediminis]MBW8638827.1 hypothetical protein [Flavimaribacter sediminis]
MKSANNQAERYFDAMRAALDGLDVFLGDRTSPFYQHGLIAQVVSAYIERLNGTFDCWRNRIGFADRFRIQRAESGFPVYHNVLELANDRKAAKKRLAAIPDAEDLRRQMVDHIFTKRSFPARQQEKLAERLYLESLRKGDVFLPFMLPETVKVSVNPKSGRPYCVVHWGVFDGTRSLPMVYLAVIEDSSSKLTEMLVTKENRLNRNIEIPLPVEGLLNPLIAHEFDAFAEKNSAYSLSPATIAVNMDKDFDELHPKQLHRFVLGPFYSAGITEHNNRVTDVLSRVSRPENAWMLTWTLQEVVSKSEKPARHGLWSSQPAKQEFHIETNDLEATRQGVSYYENHALVTHDAYQALFASNEAADVFQGYSVHVISGNQIISEVHK